MNRVLLNIISIIIDYFHLFIFLLFIIPFITNNIYLLRFYFISRIIVYIGWYLFTFDCWLNLLNNNILYKLNYKYINNKNNKMLYNAIKNILPKKYSKYKVNKIYHYFNYIRDIPFLIACYKLNLFNYGVIIMFLNFIYYHILNNKNKISKNINENIFD